MNTGFSDKRGLPKNLLMMMDLIDRVNAGGWTRPVYYAITASRDNYLGLEPFLHREGLAYRLMPVKGNDNDLFSGSVNTPVMYDNVMNKFRWGNIEDPDVYLDENNLRMITNFRYTFSTLANALLEENQKDSAVKVLDRCMQLFPNSRVPFNAAIMPIIQLYYNMGELETANSIVREFGVLLDQEMYWYEELRKAKPNKFILSNQDYQFAFRNLYSLYSLAESYGQKELVDFLSGLMGCLESFLILLLGLHALTMVCL